MEIHKIKIRSNGIDAQVPQGCVAFHYRPTHTQFSCCSPLLFLFFFNAIDGENLMRISMEKINK